VSNTLWPQIDPDTPASARDAIVEGRLNELKVAVAHAGSFTEEQRNELLWLIDIARGWKLLRRGGAWGLALLAGVATVASQFDAFTSIFKR
jgi:hypothetical protein